MATAWSKVLDATSCSMPAVSTHCFSLHLGEVDSLPSGCAWSTLHLGEREPPCSDPDGAAVFTPVRCSAQPLQSGDHLSRARVRRTNRSRNVGPTNDSDLQCYLGRRFLLTRSFCRSLMITATTVGVIACSLLLSFACFRTG